mmetsp:Transcript_22211/g.38073  ORF Transcript_22211/g.38073 Transcript_22211/m.38073 type:complete len:211 (-) Transcript_22211:1608-2240(-)
MGISLSGTYSRWWPMWVVESHGVEVSVHGVSCADAWRRLDGFERVVSFLGCCAERYWRRAWRWVWHFQFLGFARHGGRSGRWWSIRQTLQVHCISVTSFESSGEAYCSTNIGSRIHSSGYERRAVSWSLPVHHCGEGGPSGASEGHGKDGVHWPDGTTFYGYCLSTRGYSGGYYHAPRARSSEYAKSYCKPDSIFGLQSITKEHVPMSNG